MTIARSTGALIGTDESTGVSVSSGSTNTGTEKDILGDDTSGGVLRLYACFTQPDTAPALLEVEVFSNRVTGQTYRNAVGRFSASGKSEAAAQKVYLGSVEASRYMYATVTAHVSDLTNVAVLYELEKVS